MPWKRCLPQSGSSSKHVAKKYRLSEDVIVTPDREDHNSFLLHKGSTHSPREFVKKVKVVTHSTNFHTRNDNRKKIWETNTFRPIGAEEREERDSISLAGRRCPVFKSIVRGHHHILGGEMSSLSPQKVTQQDATSVFRPVRPIAMRRTGGTASSSSNIKRSLLDETQTHIRTFIRSCVQRRHSY